MRVPESLYHGSRVVGLQGGCFGEEAWPRPSPEGVNGEWRMVNGRGDTSPRFDALPRGNGRWRSRKAVGGERFAGRGSCGGKKQLRPVLCDAKRRRVAVREREASLLQIPGQGGFGRNSGR